MVKLIDVFTFIENAILINSAKLVDNVSNLVNMKKNILIGIIRLYK